MMSENNGYDYEFLIDLFSNPTENYYQNDLPDKKGRFVRETEDDVLRFMVHSLYWRDFFR